MLFVRLTILAALGTGSLASAAEGLPKVALSEQHRAMCKVGVGDQLPELVLKTPNGDDQELAALLGKKASVVVFYKSDGWMTRTLLADLGPDVTGKFGKSGVAAVAIAIGKQPKLAKEYFALSDPEESALELLGKDKLPRVYLVDAKGKILWFDIEYSMSTRRELQQALRTISSQPSE